jgi:hypothetical protein
VQLAGRERPEVELTHAQVVTRMTPEREPALLSR